MNIYDVYKVMFLYPQRSKNISPIPIVGDDEKVNSLCDFALD